MRTLDRPTGEGLLARLGRFSHNKRGLVTAFSLATLALSGVLISGGNEFEDGNQPPSSIEAGRALQLVSEELPVTSTNTVTYIFSSEDWDWSDEEFENEIYTSLEGLEEIGLEVLSISTAYDDRENPLHLAQHVSEDGKRIAVFVQFGGRMKRLKVSWIK